MKFIQFGTGLTRHRIAFKRRGKRKIMQTKCGIRPGAGDKVIRVADGETTCAICLEVIREARA